LKSKIRLLLLLLTYAPLKAATPEADLLIEAPQLAALLQQYGSYRATLEAYAVTQGFLLPYEKLATTVHEMIHVDSAAHRGYWINGSEYLRPYVTDIHAWPAITNKDVLPKLANDSIRNQYARNAPNNTIANCLDEINAYSHVIGFVRTHEPESLSQQVSALEGHLHMVDVYLDEIQRRGNRLSPDALSVVTRIVNYGKNALARSR